jgi:predicted kinase
MNMTLIRGLPGSGKSTLGYKIANDTGAVLFEADMYFEKNGVYSFNPILLPMAHSWCRKQTAKALFDGKSIVVTNTFSMVWELLPYVHMATEYGINPTIICLKTSYGSIHNVPEATIKKMADRWEDIKGEFTITE